ncbi:MAG: methionyl-tRNA formyltransferase [Deltaproteobacteria bacterium]|nr:methionyl-tRNA formyltransferase [Deltaproteobacteria bacterium]
MKETRIVFMGTPDFAVPSLKALIDAGFTIPAVVTRPDRPKGRGRALSMPPVKEVALKHGIQVLQPERIKDSAFLDTLKTLAPEVIVVVAYGKILPTAILTMPPKGCINLHSSLLPRYRGAAPINWAIIKGERESGVTTMVMDEGMDTGPILLQEVVLIGDDDTAQTLHNRLSDRGAGLLARTVSRVIDETIKPVSQDDSKATYAPMLKKEDGCIAWKSDAGTINNLVRGLFPWPGAYTRWNGKSLKILKGTAKVGDAREAPGTVLAVTEEGIDVATGDGIYVIMELQPESKRKMTAAEFIKGYRIGTGQILN